MHKYGRLLKRKVRVLVEQMLHGHKLRGDFSSSGTRVVAGRKKLPGYPADTRVLSAALVNVCRILASLQASRQRPVCEVLARTTKY